jgi:nanoRNase/pAp phosphatase (c-di-AMP/oligoRNAs hydrolase)
VLYDHKVVVSLLGDVQYPDMVAEVADFLLRLDGAEWSAAIGAFNGCLYCSIRTTDRDANAGDLLQGVLGAKSAGGHDRSPAGASRSVPIPPSA